MKTHVQNGLRLNFRKAEGRNQAFTRLLGRFAGANQANDLVQIVNGDNQTFQNVRPRLRLLEIVARSAGYDLLLMANVVRQNRFKSHLHGLSVGNGHHVHTHGILKLGVFIQCRQRALDVRVLFQLDYRAHAHAVAFVADVVDAAEQRLLLLRKP